jgi:hypothetical protein
MTQCPDEKNKADSVTEKTDGRNRQRDRNGRQFRACGQRQARIHGAGDETLPHCDLQGIAARDLAREVVIYSPAKAGRRDKQRASGIGGFAFLRQRKEHTSREDQGEAKSYTPVHVFAENNPRDAGGRDRLEIEQERGSTCRSGYEPKQQERRPGNASDENGPAQPGKIRPRERSFPCLAGTKRPHCGQADTRAQIEQTGNKDGIGGGEGELCQRGAGAEEQGCAERDHDAGISIHGLLK